MCGIYGVFKYRKIGLDSSVVIPIRNLVKNLSRFSVVRGHDAAGICVVNDTEIVMYKDHVDGEKITNDEFFNKALISINSSHNFRSVIGHTRMKTQGTQWDNKNNHPIICGNTIGVHNGVISNDDAVFKLTRNRKAEVDSEAIFALIDFYYKKNVSLQEAIIRASALLTGSYACAFVHAGHPREIFIFRHQNPVCFLDFNSLGIAMFASSETIIRSAVNATPGLNMDMAQKSLLLSDDTGMRIFLDSEDMTTFELRCGRSISPNKFNRASIPAQAHTHVEKMAYANTMMQKNWECERAITCSANCTICGANMDSAIH